MIRRRDYIIVAAVLAVGWSFWLQRMGVNDFDDMLSNEVIFARQGVSNLLFHNPWPDQSPLYFLFLHIVRWVGESVFVFQFANALLLSATLAATYMFGLEFSRSRTVAAAAMFLGAVSPTSLWLVRNGRMYSLQVLLSVLASVFVLRYLDRRRPRDLIAFGLVSILNVYNHFVGFMITALLFVPLVAEAWRDARRGNRDRSVKASQPLVPLTVAAVGLLLLTVPQIVRFARLVVLGAPVRGDVSLPALSPQFLNRVSWFWFVNADWGSLRPADQVVTALYVGCIVILAVAGLASVRRRTGVAAATWILLPLVGVGLSAARMDVRDRYFVWTLPLLWIAVATGAFGALPWRRLSAAGDDIARGFRAALMVAVAAGSVWLLWNKVPEGYPHWTKLMTGLEEVYRPSMVVYMPPSSPIGTPRLIASQLNLPQGLQDIRNLSAETHDQFLNEVERGREFVFLLYGNAENDEMRWRIHYLEEQQYQRAALPVFGASAQIFTRGAVEGFSIEQKVTGDASPDTVVAWARRELQRPQTVASESPLASAVVARVGADGVVRKGRLFMTQHGENGSWRLGPRDWDAVEEIRTSSGGVERNVIAAHPADDSILVVAFPAVKMNRSLRLSYGIADSGVLYRGGARVDFALYVDGEKRLGASCPNAPGWKELWADTANVANRNADVVLLVTTPHDAARHFAFRFEPSSEPALGSRSAAHDAGPVVLTGAARLSEAVDRLRVYRVEGDRRIDARVDGRTYSAEDMHEETGSGGEGAVRRQWALGALLWDAVGVTRQRSGGQPRDGLWAHPRNGTTLVLEAPAVQTGELLRGGFGFTDRSVVNANAVGVTAPVKFTVWIDGRRAFERDVPRSPGWADVVIPIAGAGREHAIRITVACAIDSWAHFIFDLWSE